MASLEEIRGRLEELADPALAEGARRFFMEPVKAYGVPAAALRELEREFRPQVNGLKAADRNRLCTELLRGGHLEESMLVSYLYSRFAKECAECEFKLFESWIDRHVQNWSACDAICTKLIRASLANVPKLVAQLPAWTKSQNVWKRRAAAVSLVHEGRAGRHLEAILGIADTLLDDEAEMVRKGVGWLLKETYPKHARQTVAFLTARGPRVPRLVLRYAAEKMTPADKQKVMAR